MLNLESAQNCIINKQTDTLTKIDTEVTDLGLKFNAMDEGLKTTVIHIDKDLEALDDRIGRRRWEFDIMSEELHKAEGKIDVLEERSRSQLDLIEKLMACVESMEGCLCKCGEKADKEKEVEQVVDDVSSPILGSPLVLNRDTLGSDDSYHTPPGTLSLAQGSDKENVESSAVLVEIKDDEENEVALLVVPPPLNFASIHHLVAVRGQRATRTLGPPCSYHPYARCCAIGDRDSTHRPGNLCLPPTLACRSRSSSCRNRHKGSNSSSESSLQVDGDDRWAGGF